MVEYHLRVVDQELDQLSDSLPAISIEGPKGVGKTATAQRRASASFALDDPRTLEVLQADPGRIERAPQPVLIDEWQRYPPVWDWVRRSVDHNSQAGRYLLTGSATPIQAPTHSGAGRVVRLRMRPMALAERGVAQQTVSLADLLSDGQPPIDGESTVELPSYTREIVSSGFPAIRGLSPRAQRAQLDGYIARIVEHDFPEQGQLVRRPAALRAWLTAYAAATATTASYNSILDAATPGEPGKPSRGATQGYRDVLGQIWLLEPLPAWLPARNAFTRLSQAPKHHLADPALAARLLGANQSSLLEATPNDTRARLSPRDGQLLGALFESLVALDVRVYAQAAEASVAHLRTRNGDHEVDFIVERDDHRVLAIEVKLSTVVSDKDVVHLRWLSERLGDDLLDAVVITTGKYAYRRADGIAVIPAALLGP